MTYAAEYHLNILDDHGRRTDTLHPSEDVEVYLRDGYRIRGIISGVGGKGLSLEKPHGSTFYNFGNILKIERAYPGTKKGPVDADPNVKG